MTRTPDITAAKAWRCSECGKPSPDRLRNCPCPSSRVSNGLGISAAKVAIPWREELRAAVETLAQRSAT